MVTNGERILRFVTSHYIPIAELGAALVELATVGDERRVWSNGELRKRGQTALEAT